MISSVTLTLSRPFSSLFAASFSDVFFNESNSEVIFAIGYASGVTTNPSLMAKEGITGQDNIIAHYKAICEIVKGDVSSQISLASKRHFNHVFFFTFGHKHLIFLINLKEKNMFLMPAELPIPLPVE